MAKENLTPNERTRELFNLVRDVENGNFDSKPDKVAKHEAAQAFPKLAARDIETAFSVVHDRGRGRPSTKR